MLIYMLISFCFQNNKSTFFQDCKLNTITTMKTPINPPSLLLLVCLILCSLASCNEEETTITDVSLTAEDIEHEFGFTMTTPDDILLERYGSWENYRALLLDFNAKKEEDDVIHTESLPSRVRLYNVAVGLDKTIVVPIDRYILDAAEDNGIKLPYSDRVGVSGTCAGQLMSGKVDQSEQSFLDEEQMARGYVLLCVAYALEDSTIETHQEHELY